MTTTSANTPAREIKFRSWDTELNKFNDNLGTYFLQYTDLNNTVTENIILMQYTGLKDKNGKECYEDDLIKIDESIYHVVWQGPPNGAGFYLGLYKGSAVTALRMYRVPDGEIVGNIYEN